MPYIVPSQDIKKASNVIGMTVRQHHHIEGSVPEWKRTAKKARRVL